MGNICFVRNVWVNTFYVLIFPESSPGKQLYVWKSLELFLSDFCLISDKQEKINRL